MIAEKIRTIKGYPWVGLYDVKENEIALIAFAGRTEPVFNSFPKDKGLNGRAVGAKQTIVVNNIDTDEDYLLTFRDTESEIIVPVFDKRSGEVAGTIDAVSENKNAFSKEDADFLEECAKTIEPLWSKQ